MTPHDIILIGASVRSLAQSAIRDGLRPFCIDFFADADLIEIAGAKSVRSIRNSAEALSAISSLDNEIPVLLTGGLETDGDFHRLLLNSRRVINSPPEVVESVRNPTALFGELSHANCDVLPWSLTPPTEEIDEAASPRKWLQKSVSESGGGGVRFHSLRDERSNPGTWFQAWSEGIAFSATFSALAEADEPVLIGAALQLSGCSELNAAGFSFCGNAGPVQLSKLLEDRVRRVGSVIASSFSLQGIFGVDFLWNGRRLFVLEVNPRPTASHELFEWSAPDSSGVVLQQMQSSTSTRTNVTNFENRPQSPRARLILYADRPTKISASTMLDLMSSALHAVGPDHGLSFADIPSANTSISAGEPVCSVYVNLTGTWRDDIQKTPFAKDLWNTERVGSLLDQTQGRIEQLSTD